MKQFFIILSFFLSFYKLNSQVSIHTDKVDEFTKNRIIKTNFTGTGKYLVKSDYADLKNKASISATYSSLSKSRLRPVVYHRYHPLIVRRGGFGIVLYYFLMSFRES